MCKYKIDKITYSKTGSIIPELQNRVTKPNYELPRYKPSY